MKYRSIKIKIHFDPYFVQEQPKLTQDDFSHDFLQCSPWNCYDSDVIFILSLLYHYHELEDYEVETNYINVHTNILHHVGYIVVSTLSY